MGKLVFLVTVEVVGQLDVVGGGIVGCVLGGGYGCEWNTLSRAFGLRIGSPCVSVSVFLCVARIAEFPL